MDWYAAKEGNQLGPIPESRLSEMFRAGELTGETMVWRNGMPDWLPLATAMPDWFPPKTPPALAFQNASTNPGGPVLTALVTQGNGFVYRNPKPRAMMAKVSMLMMTVSGCLVSLIEFAVPARPEAEASLIDVFVGFLALGLLVSIVLSIVFFCMWTHRVVANSYAFGGRFNEITPGWAVGWYFIPFANLVKPYQALKQAWQTTHDETDAPGVLPAWWGLWIASNIIGNISFRLTMNDMAEEAMIADLITFAIDLPLMVCVWLVITRLTKRQVERVTLPFTPEQ